MATAKCKGSGSTKRAAEYGPLLKSLTLAALSVAGLAASHPTFAADPTAPTPTAQVANARRHLGELLFGDTRLSGNGTSSCATCHQPDRYFTDGLPVAVGATGQQLARNTPSLLNAGNFASYGWTNDGVTDLAVQHLQPLTNTAPVEMGFDAAALALLAQDAKLASLRSQAFPTSANFTLGNITQALASYVASLEYRSAFDDYLMFDDTNALSDSAKRGLALFTSERLGCSGCHQGPLLGGGWREGAEILLPPVYLARKPKRLEVRTPSLRAAAFTAPYMMDGRLPTLAAVVTFYSAGGNDTVEFRLSPAEQNNLLAFLRSL